MKHNPIFVKILKSFNLDVNTGVIQEDNSLRLGSIYTEGDWYFNTETGIATRITCKFNNDEDKIIVIRSYKLIDNAVVKIYEEQI